MASTYTFSEKCPLNQALMLIQAAGGVEEALIATERLKHQTYP